MVEEMVKRWGIVDRINHWILLIGMVILIVTGLPLFYPDYFGFLNQWISSRLMFQLHRGPWSIGPILIIISAAIHVIQRTWNFTQFTGERKTWMLPSRKDISDFIQITKRWFNPKAEYPKLGFHHPGEKMIYWGASVLGILLTGVSGIMLWFPEYFLGLRSWAYLIHDVGFALIAIFIAGHFTLSITPKNWKITKGMMVTGKVPKAWAEHHHPLWAKEWKS